MIKIKPLTKDQIIISIDRLTRFKETEAKYLRVFKEIILSNLIEPKYKKNDLEKLDYEEIKELAEYIINFSLNAEAEDLTINQYIFDYENSIFKLDENTQKLLKNKICYNEIINLLPDVIPDNLRWLKSINGKICNDFPIKQILLCEGITEEILIPVFAKLCGFDLKYNGIHIISAGGKNQVVKYFYKFASCLKIPMFVLMDKDAEENLIQIRPKLRKYDKIHILKCGEFEDLLPETLIIKTLKYATQNISFAPIDNINEYSSRVEFLEDFFKHRGLHEFKKSEFANLVKKNITEITDASQEIKDIINELSDFKIIIK